MDEKKQQRDIAGIADALCVDAEGVPPRAD
jgi:hypothetical protein